MPDVSFPLFLTEPTDSACTVHSFSSVKEMQGYVEEIDVRNGEFQVWDANGAVLELEVREGSEWLAVVPTGAIDLDGLMERIRCHAAYYGPDLGDTTGLTPAEVLARADQVKVWPEGPHMSPRTKVHLLCFLAAPLGIVGAILLAPTHPSLSLLFFPYVVLISILVNGIRCPQCHQPIAGRWYNFMGTRSQPFTCFVGRYCVHCGYDLDRRESGDRRG